MVERPCLVDALTSVSASVNRVGQALTRRKKAPAPGGTAQVREKERRVPSAARGTPRTAKRLRGNRGDGSPR